MALALAPSHSTALWGALFGSGLCISGTAATNATVVLLTEGIIFNRGLRGAPCRTCHMACIRELLALQTSP